MVPEKRKQPGVCYAFSDDGLELPVIDITHPAFAMDIGRDELIAVADRTERSMGRSARMPGFVQRFVRNRSILVRQTLEASGGYLSGMATYLQKLGPGNLGRGYAGRLDRRIARSIGPVSNRLRLRETARLVADGLESALKAAPPGAAVHLINIGGGPAIDSINALILVRREHHDWLTGRRIVIHVFDIDGAGPRFGARALTALLAPGAPLDGLDAAFAGVAYDWRQPAVLGESLARLALDDAVVGISSEGALFEYGTDAEVIANLEVLLAATPREAAVTGSIILDDRVGRLMKSMSRMQLQLRSLDDVAGLAGRAGWRLARTAGRGFVHEVFSLRQA